MGEKGRLQVVQALILFMPIAATSEKRTGKARKGKQLPGLTWMMMTHLLSTSILLCHQDLQGHQDQDQDRHQDQDSRGQIQQGTQNLMTATIMMTTSLMMTTLLRMTFMKMTLIIRALSLTWPQRNTG